MAKATIDQAPTDIGGVPYIKPAQLRHRLGKVSQKFLTSLGTIGSLSPTRFHPSGVVRIFLRPRLKIGRKTWYAVADVNRFLEQCLIVSGQPSGCTGAQVADNEGDDVA